ncbi:MAG TPA: metallophosphoesterase [Candidatus Limnocylindrales bacterium]|nr:metallophosphoesterase [Candidatus Limnocylindrales bacterium]
MRSLRHTWPDPRPFADRDGRPIRLLAVSDEPEWSLRDPRTRAIVGRVDGILGCGDLEPDWLAFLADAFCAPLVYVRGNHDAGDHWHLDARRIPESLGHGRVVRVGGIDVAGFEWPGVEDEPRRRHEPTAWREALELAWSHSLGRLAGRSRPLLVISHAPPRGLGDVGSDPFHRGFAAYRWLIERLHPPLWLHGHTPPAAQRAWRCRHAGTTVVDVSGALVLELEAPDDRPAISGSGPTAPRG